MVKTWGTSFHGCNLYMGGYGMCVSPITILGHFQVTHLPLQRNTTHRGHTASSLHLSVFRLTNETLFALPSVESVAHKTSSAGHLLQENAEFSDSASCLPVSSDQLLLGLKHSWAQ